jgi:hypothetical protein
MAAVTTSSGIKESGWNALAGYGKIEYEIPPPLTTTFVPSPPDVDPMMVWHKKTITDPAQVDINECASFKVSETDYNVAMVRANQKGYKATKSGVHGTNTEMYNTGMFHKVSRADESKSDESPSLDLMNKEYNRQLFGYKTVPPALGTTLQGSAPAILAGNQIIYQPSTAMGSGEGGRRFGREADKYALPFRPEN